MADKRKFLTCDGGYAAAHVSYAFTEAAGIYPITPSTDMAELTDAWSAAGKKNIFGETVRVVEMQSEAGAAGVVHGSLQAGALTSTYTASQGLLLMIPNMFKIAGEQLPCVFHVSARAIATHALSIFGDHSDINATRMTGFSLLSAASVQEVMDLGAVAHLASIKASMPFLHFLDGFRTSHEIQKIQAWDYDDLSKLVDRDALKRFRDRALNPENPSVKGVAQNPDVFFQAREASNKAFDAIPGIVELYMNEVNKLTDRDYKLFNYYGAPDAEHVIIAMGSVCETIKETVDYLVNKGEKVGVIIVHLYRPFSAKHFLSVLPKSTKKIAVLDRTKEPGALGEPLYMDVKTVLANSQHEIVGGRYGLASKDTSPKSIIAVFENLKQKESKNGFTVGINDDVTFLSLPEGDAVNTVPEGTVECKFYGLGSDGTVGANKNSIKIIGDHTSGYAQGYFAYDSKKSGGITTSHLRFGKQPITSTYLVTSPDFVSCSEPSYLQKYDMLKGMKPNGTFLLNSFWTKEEVVKHLPNFMKRQLAQKNIKFYIIDATKIAIEVGLGNRTNTIMQAAFFKLANIIPYEDAVKYMKEAVYKSYSKKGEEVLKMNTAAIDRGAGDIVQIEVPEEWKTLSGNLESVTYKGVLKNVSPDLQKFVDTIASPINQLEGDSLPVSAFMDWVDGGMPVGTSQFEKRGIAVQVPEWQPENCIQCNQCAYVCPHAVIRPFLIDEKEMAAAPEGMTTLKPLGAGFDGLQYRIQIDVLDCTGCGSCAQVCPANKGKALIMKEIDTQRSNEANWDYLSQKVTYKDHLVKKNTVKNSQFAKPLFEFSGACAGCGETPYLKLITQLYGERLAIANATGCSSIYGGSYPSSPYVKGDNGKGPAWGNSLFEDNAEFGLGMHLGMGKLRERVQLKVKANLDTVSSELKGYMQAWLDNFDNSETTIAVSSALEEALEIEGSAFAKDLLELKNHFVKKSTWIVGGDGWAYDIGFGGLDHVLASGENVNVIVLDTEVYSNTGGQASKSSTTAAIAKFAAAGKQVRKKDLGRMAMTYGYVYVAQVSMGANQAHFLKVLQEAEAFPGPSLIIAYAPCIAHGIKKQGLTISQSQEKRVVESGYWHLFRYNPQLEAEGKNPFQLDSKEPKFDLFVEHLRTEVRFASLEQQDPERAKLLFSLAVDDAKWRYKQYRLLAEMNYAEKQVEVPSSIN
jgi:pyruvate-ferredoxin/flavodoxin oxidoreductase